MQHYKAKRQVNLFRIRRMVRLTKSHRLYCKLILMPICCHFPDCKAILVLPLHLVPSRLLQ